MCCYKTFVPEYKNKFLICLFIQAYVPVKLIDKKWRYEYNEKKTKGGEQVDNNATERDPLYVAIGSRIKQIRKSKGMTQTALAHEVGIAASHMSHIESAQSNASLKTIMRIADALCVGVAALLCDGLKTGNLVYQAELDKILADCSIVEVKAILEVAAVTKESIRTATRKNTPSGDES